MAYVLKADYDVYEDGRWTFDCGYAGSGAPTIRRDDYDAICEWCDQEFPKTSSFRSARWFTFFEEYYPYGFMISFESLDDAMAFREQWVTQATG